VAERLLGAICSVVVVVALLEMFSLKKALPVVGWVAACSVSVFRQAMHRGRVKKEWTRWNLAGAMVETEWCQQAVMTKLMAAADAKI
jgi:hypothetical protein